MTLLAEIRAYCEANPHDGPMPQAEAITLRRHADGSVTVLGPVPDVLDISPELLDSDTLMYVTWHDGTLTIHAADGDLNYRPLGQPYASFAIRFQRSTGPDMTDTITVYASIGNSDDKLTQRYWHDFYRDFTDTIRAHADTIYGDWTSPSTDPWQNACIAFEVDRDRTGSLRQRLRELATQYHQDSIAWAEATTQFLTSCARCKGRGYIPDFSNGLSEEHGEPGKKPCPDCQETTCS